MKTIKKYWLFILFVVLCLIIIITISLKNGFSFSFTENTGLYLYSSLIQANAAIISIFGVFYIFRLQSLQSAIAEIYESLSNVNIPVSNAAREFRHLSFQQKKEKIESYREDNDIVIEYKKWYDYEEKLNGLKVLIKKPTFIIITLISIQIFFLVLSNDFHKSGYTFELVCFIVISLFQIYVLFLLGNAIIAMVK